MQGRGNRKLRHLVDFRDFFFSYGLSCIKQEKVKKVVAEWVAREKK